MTEPNLLDLEGRVSIVTGAGQGVGAQTARYFAAYGSAVVVNDYFADRADAVATEITAAGGTAIGVQADVTDFGAVQGLVQAATDAFGAVHVLVNNAGNAGADVQTVVPKLFWE